jgi:hypothetical protein
MSPGSDLGARTGFEPHFFASQVVGDEPLRKNVLAFADRHDFSLTFSHSEPSAELDAALADAAEMGVEVMLNVGGPYEDVGTDADVVADEETMAAHREQLREVTEAYAQHFPEGRVYVWHEAPIHGNWRQQGELAKVARRREMAENIVEHGVEMFPTELETVRDVSPDIDVGTFIHHPLLPSAEHTKMPVFSELMAELEAIDSLPDFTYCDMYRGYYEWEGGYDGINDYIEDIVRNIRESTHGRPVHILLQAHTINNFYTPSKQAIVGNAQSAIDGGADGIGWYFRGGFRETHERNFNPFVPNHGEADGEQFASWTGSRDRLQYASLLLAEQQPQFDAGQHFDLLLHGENMAFYDHSVSVRGPDGDWEHVGDVSGYADGDNPYSGGDRERVHALRALDRKYLEDGLEVRIESATDADDATLHGVYALPYSGTPRFYTEGDATERVDAFAGAAIATDDAEASLAPGGTVTKTLAAVDPARDLTDVVYPDAGDAFDDALAAEDGTSYREHFDLWVYGRDLGDADVRLGDTHLATEHGAAGDSEVLVARDLPLSEFATDHRSGAFLDFSAATGDADLRAAYAMPSHGAANFQPADAAAATVAAEHTDGHGQIARFCLGTAFWPDGTADVDDVEAFLHVDDHHVMECDPVPDRHPIYSSTQW